MRCFAYRIAGEHGDLTLSGDTEAFPELARFADGSSVLFHDCSFPDTVDVSNHPTPAALGEVLSGCEIDVVYLTHLYPHTEGVYDAMVASIAARYDGEVRIAADNLVLEC